MAGDGVNNVNNTDHISCPIFPEHPHRCLTLIAIRRTSGSISLIGCVFIIFVIWLFKKYVSFSQRLILYMSISGFFLSISFLMGGLTPDGPVCDFQAMWMQFFHWSLLLWICCITFNLYVNIVWQKNTEKYEWVYHGISWLFPLLMSLIPFIGDHYGPAGAWCWVKGDWRWRVGVWYGPQICTVIILLVVYGYITYVLNRKVANWEGTYDPDTERAKQMLREDIKPLKFYPFVYMAASIFGIINRIQNAADPQPVYGLMILQVIFSPSKGFLNAIVFGMDRETFRRLTPTQIKLAFLNKFSKKAIIHEFPADTSISEHETST